ncbi:MAG TPA: hypothetical protein VEY67_05855 [Candidatus Dormibacteraeota bacterium]|nr:hypothetical protein [Candidatus Dormibacteraeota bacterium]
MVEALQLLLDDGSTIEAILEGDDGEDVLRTLGRLRVVAGDQDVEGHRVTSTIDVIVYGEDDVEGHAMTLRLPHPEAARELQRKLLAAGVVGVIVVGAATASMWVPETRVGAAADAGAAAAARAPISRGLQAEREDSIVATTFVRAPQSSALRAEREDSVVATPGSAPADPADGRGMRAE